MANARDNITDTEKRRDHGGFYRHWLTWLLPSSTEPNRQWFRNPSDREEFAAIFRQLGAHIEQGES